MAMSIPSMGIQFSTVTRVCRAVGSGQVHSIKDLWEETKEELQRQEDIKNNILNAMSEAKKNLYTSYADQKDVIAGCEETDRLCSGVEAMLLHGLHAKKDVRAKRIWQLVVECIPDNIIHELKETQEESHVGMVRAYVRDVLNTPGAPMSLECILTKNKTVQRLVRNMYREYALMRDMDKRSGLMAKLHVLQFMFTFNLRLDHPCLREDWSSHALQLLIHSSYLAPRLAAPTPAPYANEQVVKTRRKNKAKRKNKDPTESTVQHGPVCLPASRTEELLETEKERETQAGLEKGFVGLFLSEESTQKKESFEESFEDIYAVKPCPTETIQNKCLVAETKSTVDDKAQEMETESSTKPDIEKESQIKPDIEKEPRIPEEVPSEESTRHSEENPCDKKATEQKDLDKIYQDLLNATTQELLGCLENSGFHSRTKARLASLERSATAQCGQLPCSCFQALASKIVGVLNSLFRELPQHPLEPQRLRRRQNKFLERYTSGYTLSTETKMRDIRRCAVCCMTFDQDNVRVCHMSGQKCCQYCHTNRKAIIPYYAIKHFDLEKYPVCDVACDYLKKIERRACIGDFCFQYGGETIFATRTAAAICLPGRVVLQSWKLGEEAIRRIVEQRLRQADVSLDNIRPLRLFSVQELILVKKNELHKLLQESLGAMERRERSQRHHKQKYDDSSFCTTLCFYEESSFITALCF